MSATRKFVDMIHYVCSTCDEPAALGATKLNKIAWFSDTLSYRLTGSSISGETYVKRQFGPVPKNVLAALETLAHEGKIIQREPKANFQPREFVSLQPVDASVFSDQERNLMDTIVQAVCRNHTATSISGLSHDQVWDAAAMGEEIPLHAVLAATPGEITNDDLAWADSVINSVSQQGSFA
jgi:hypothetical protein